MLTSVHYSAADSNATPMPMCASKHLPSFFIVDGKHKTSHSDKDVVGGVKDYSQNSGMCPNILGKGNVAAIRLNVMTVWNYQEPGNLCREGTFESDAKFFHLAL